MRILNYIGSKNKLINFIKTVIKKNNITDGTFGDLFAGSNVVSYNFKDDFNIVNNDIEYYSFIIATALLKCPYNNKLEKIINELNNVSICKYNKDKHLISKYYSEYGNEKRLFWSKENALKGDIIMNKILEYKEQKEVNKNESIFLIASLIQSLDKVSNTTSVYGAYLKSLKPSAKKKMIYKPIHTNLSIKNNHTIYNINAINIKTKLDIAYLDPPYNNRQYGANYGPLNFIAQYDNNIIPYGKTGLMPNYYKSNFSIKKKVYDTMNSLIKNLNCDKILISYNNEGLITEEKFIDILLQYGSVKIYKKSYNRYKSSNINTKKKVFEYLYFLDKTIIEKKVKKIIL